MEAWGLEYARMTEGQTSGGLQGAPEAWASRESCTKADPRGPGERGCLGETGPAHLQSCFLLGQSMALGVWRAQFS